MKAKTNILFLQTDQHRWDALGCVNPIVKTPNTDGDNPFFLYLSFDFPHAALNVPAKYEAMYDMAAIELPETAVPIADLDDHYTQPRNVEEWRAWRNDFSADEQKRSILRYYAACTYIDDMFGQVLAKLDAMNELENTLIVFTSDHGESLGERYRFSKYSLYETSVRVPLILAGCGVATAHQGTTVAWSRFPRPYSYTDIY